MATAKKAAVKKAAPIKKVPPPVKAPRQPKLTKVDAEKVAVQLATEKPQVAGLRRSPLSGVFYNRANVMVDGRGVALPLKKLKELNDAADREVIGKRAESPAEYLKREALDPRNPQAVRIDAAKAAAQYFTPKLSAISGNPNGAPIAVVDLTNLTKEQLIKRQQMLEEIGKMQGLIV